MPKVIRKSRRKSWKKVNVEDVEEALEDERLVGKIKRQSLKGKAKGPEVEIDEAEDLFTVDTKGSTEGLSKKTRRELARAKAFPSKEPRLGLSGSEQLKVQRAEARLKNKKRHSKLGQKEEAFDLWAPPDAKAKAKAAKEAAWEHVKRVPHPVPKQVPKNMYKKNSTAPAVLPAHEGQSINPAPQCFEELACLAAARELEREEEVRDRKRQMNPITFELTERFGAEAVEKMSEEEKVETYRKLQCTLEIDTDANGETPAMRSQKLKSEAKRRKEAVGRKRAFIEDKRKQEKALEKSVGEIGTILKEMKDEEEARKAKKEHLTALRRKREELEEKEGIIPKFRKIGKRSQFAEPALSVPEMEAAPKGLRTMPVSAASAVRDRHWRCHIR
mmetsp:Transcript_64464/g.135264  ORF Transcript_64464/g.135264 Transcript_64464/m.135264 type:complete len:388 (+) Transcript_64464:82-1245(+)